MYKILQFLLFVRSSSLSRCLVSLKYALHPAYDWFFNVRGWRDCKGSLLWRRLGDLSFAAVMSQSDNTGRIVAFWQTQPAIFTSAVGLRQPIRAERPPLHKLITCMQLCTKRERKSKNEWCGQDRGWFVLNHSTFMPILCFNTIFEVSEDVFYWLL